MTKSFTINRLYNLYNKEAFEGCLPEEMDIIWDSRLRNTAGTCSQGGKVDRKSGKVIERKSSIKLSIKVNSRYLDKFSVGASVIGETYDIDRRFKEYEHFKGFRFS